ncbi:hypothetical protein [Allorhizocola rhizosphaerae]|uniref:hypothetical protein n=1 Tax=Allorhizocola rhizosphaerae TaxID=1872709 RepID=UPI000E3BA242|nr:hypothetical protein [Allorhizocola rhizosphaerae]
MSRLWRDLNAPDGVNLMANTSARGLTIPMVPVTMAFGAEVGFALLTALGRDANRRARLGAKPRPTATLMRDVHRTGKAPLVTPVMRQQFREDVAYWRALQFCCCRTTRPASTVQLRLVLNDLAGEAVHPHDVWLWRVTG